MHHNTTGCGGPAADKRRFERDLQSQLKSLSCVCLDKVAMSNTVEACALFRLTEFGGQSPGQAAQTLGLDQNDARKMLADVRCDIALTLALALVAPPGSRTGGRYR